MKHLPASATIEEIIDAITDECEEAPDSGPSARTTALYTRRQTLGRLEDLKKRELALAEFAAMIARPGLAKGFNSRRLPSSALAPPDLFLLPDSKQAGTTGRYGVVKPSSGNLYPAESYIEEEQRSVGLSLSRITEHDFKAWGDLARDAAAGVRQQREAR